MYSNLYNEHHNVGNEYSLIFLGHQVQRTSTNALKWYLDVENDKSI